jgi:hypothetical protein
MLGKGIFHVVATLIGAAKPNDAPVGCAVPLSVQHGARSGVFGCARRRAGHGRTRTLFS